MAQVEQEPTGLQIEGEITLRDREGNEYTFSAEKAIDIAYEFGREIGKANGRREAFEKLLIQEARKKAQESGYGGH